MMKVLTRLMIDYLHITAESSSKKQKVESDTSSGESTEEGTNSTSLCA